MPQPAPLLPGYNEDYKSIGVRISNAELPTRSRRKVHDRGLYLLEEKQQRCEDYLDYFVDLTRWLEDGETISGVVAWGDPQGDPLIKQAFVIKVSFGDAGVLLWVTGGSDGGRSTIHCRVVTTTGRQKLIRFRLVTRGTPIDCVVNGGNSTVTVGNSEGEV